MREQSGSCGLRLGALECRAASLRDRGHHRRVVAAGGGTGQPAGRPARFGPARGTRLVAAAAGSLLWAVSASARADRMLDDFESPGAPAPWVFSNGPEFPGAVGSLTAIDGHTGTGARLTYDLTCTSSPPPDCDPHYVAATLNLTEPVVARAVRLWVRASPGTRANLRVVDETGQTLQYRIPRSLEGSVGFDASGWQPAFVPLDVPAGHWGGANDGVLHGSISSVSILAADPVEPRSAGMLDFDEVLAIDSPAAGLLDPLAPALATLDGPLAPRLGVNIHFVRDDTALDILRDMGVSFVRMDLSWSWVESTAGVYDFSDFDDLLDALEARGMWALLILDYGNRLHADGTTPDGRPLPPQSAATIDAFGDYAEAAARHFAGRSVRFEVWNEPNIPQFWPPAADAAAYAALAREAVARVHAGNPAALVSTGGLSGVDVAYLRQVVAAGGTAGADAVGVHPYRRGAPESAVEDLLALRAVAPTGLPLWDTEWGYSSAWYGEGDPEGGHGAAARAQQARMLVREVLTAWILGFPLAVLYDVRDDGDDPSDAEHNFGLIAADYADKPAAVAVRTLSRIAAEGTAFELLEPPADGLHALRLETPRGPTVVVWAEPPGAAASLSLAATPASATDMYGAPRTVEGTTVTLREDEGPVYLRFDRPAADADADGDADAALEDDGGETTADAGTDAVADGEVGESAGAPDSGPASDSAGCGCRATAFARNDGVRLGALATALLVGVAARRRRAGKGETSLCLRLRKVVVIVLFLASASAACASSPPATACAGIDCSGHGFCAVQEGAAYCVCESGFHPVDLTCVANDPADPCRGIDCDGHGTCRVTDDSPGCVCDPGYEAVGDLHCVPVGGADADADAAGDADADADADRDADGDAGDALRDDGSDTACSPPCVGRSCGVDPVCGVDCGDCGRGARCTAAGACEAFDPDAFYYRVEPPEVIAGPGNDIDTIFNTLRTPEGLFGYTGNATTYAWFGSSLEDMVRLSTPVIGRGTDGRFDECGAWLNGARRVGDRIYGWYHAEEDCAYPITHKSVAFAESRDGGRTFERVGYPGNRVLTADVAFDGDVDRDDAGDPSFVDVDGYHYMYFLATADWRVHLARSPIGEGGPGTWTKYFEGGFTEPGLGGRSSPIPGLAGFHGAAWDDAFHQLISLTLTPGTWSLGLAASPDGLSFTPFEHLLIPLVDLDWDRGPGDNELLAYPSLVGLDGDNQHIGESFWLYHMYLLPGEGFDRRYLLRRRVTREAVAPGDAVGPITRLALVRSRKAAVSDDWVTTIQLDPAYGDRTVLGYLLAEPIAGTVELTDCFIDIWDDHMVGVRGDCGGARALRRLGWILEADGPGRIAVYRCFDEATTNHFVSTDAACEGARVEWRIGYLLAR